MEPTIRTIQQDTITCYCLICKAWVLVIDAYRHCRETGHDVIIGYLIVNKINS